MPLEIATLAHYLRVILKDAAVWKFSIARTLLKGACNRPLGRTRSTPMDKEHLKGAAGKALSAEDAAGKATGDKRLDGQGQVR